MLGWLDRFWQNMVGTVGQGVSDAAHWAMHALASVVFSVFRLVGKAWHKFLAAVDYLGTAATDFARSVWHFARYVVEVLIPHILRWVTRELARLVADLRRLERWAAREIARLYDWIAALILRLTKWVIDHVWVPLKAYADHLWALLKQWGYVAWWFVTHPESLAERLIFGIAHAMERHAFQLGGQLGRFVLSLILRNAKAVILAIEDIFTAVL